MFETVVGKVLKIPLVKAQASTSTQNVMKNSLSFPDILVLGCFPSGDIKWPDNILVPAFP